jgi:anti-anti-sigma regulatory factor
MTEHDQDEGRQEERALLLPAPHGENEASKVRQHRDLIFDLSDTSYFNVASLSILLTACRLAHEANRDVWLAGLPDQGWTILQALGLARFFREFPGTEWEEA